MPCPSLRRAWVCALVATTLVSSAALTSPTVAAPSPARSARPPLVAGPDRPQDPVAHDPTMVKEGPWYYLAITGDAATGRDYIPMKRSKDLLHWKEMQPVFTELPDEVLAAIGATQADAPSDAWAPDLSWTGEEWRLYYSVSRFGTTNSVTALATTASLDPASPDHGWEDQGIVLETESDADYNAIDANYTADAEGAGWLTFGSFSSGLKIVELDPATGKPSPGAQVRDLARRPIEFDPIEGPSIVRERGWYYLFAAFDYCCRGVESDYRVMVGRSRRITGPYVDKAGVSMLEGGGSEVLRGYSEFQGTGHPDVFSTGGVDYLVNHYYDALDDPTPRLNVRALTWRNGWPKVGDPVNPSRSAGHGSAYVQVVPRGARTAAVGTVGCGYAGADVALTAGRRGDPCRQWQIDARDARQVQDGSETGSRFQNRHANMSADLPGCAEAESTGDVRQFDWLGNFFYNVCQRWVFSPARGGFTTIQSIAGRGLAWTVGPDPVPGSDLGVATPTGAADQQFRFQPVGAVLLGSAGDTARTLTGTGCKTARRGDDGVRMQVRARGACQAWAVVSTGGARYQVVSQATGRLLASSACRRGARRGLELVGVGGGRAACRTWTLVPRDDGSWTLASRDATRVIRLLAV